MYRHDRNLLHEYNHKNSFEITTDILSHFCRNPGSYRNINASTNTCLFSMGFVGLIAVEKTPIELYAHSQNE